MIEWMENKEMMRYVKESAMLDVVKTLVNKLPDYEIKSVLKALFDDSDAEGAE